VGGGGGGGGVGCGVGVGGGGVGCPAVEKEKKKKGIPRKTDAQSIVRKRKSKNINLSPAQRNQGGINRPPPPKLKGNKEKKRRYATSRGPARGRKMGSFW